MDNTQIAQLCRAAAFDHPTGEISVRETHISWVILCGEFAYKLKKPLDLGFLDFSSLAQRKHFCLEELRLNRRFSPELYLDVVPVTASRHGPVIGGDGTPIDYAVKMRRFEESQLLDNIAASGGLHSGLVRDIARELARLHQTLPRCYPDPCGQDAGTPSALLAALAQNFEQLRQCPLQTRQLRQLDAIEAWARTQSEILLPTMRQRVREGRVIDGHGDDHLGNMAIIDGRVRLFDCIEFNANFRIVDSIAEIALLDMDLNARGHPAESHRLLSDYLEFRDDFSGLALLNLYRVYYALVRAKVNILRPSANHTQPSGTAPRLELQRYLDMAHRYCEPDQPFLVITHGLSGSGKSTAAAQLVEASGAVRIRSDVERKRLFGLRPEQRCRQEEVAALYSTKMSARTFERLAELARHVLAAGFAVIVDGTFLHQRVRREFRALSREAGVPFAILRCAADESELIRRLRSRSEAGHDASDADVSVMQQQQRGMQPLSEDELAVTVDAPAGGSADTLYRAVCRVTGYSRP